MTVLRIASLFQASLTKADHELYPRVWVPIPAVSMFQNPYLDSPGFQEPGTYTHGYSGTRYLIPRVFRNQVPDTAGFQAQPGTVRNRP